MSQRDASKAQVETATVQVRASATALDGRARKRAPRRYGHMLVGPLTPTGYEHVPIEWQTTL